MCNTKRIWTSNKPKFTEVSATLQMSSAKTQEMGNMFIEVYKLWKNTEQQFLFICILYNWPLCTRVFCSLHLLCSQLNIAI